MNYITQEQMLDELLEHCTPYSGHVGRYQIALRKLRAALAQPAKPEPTLKWCDQCGEGVVDFCRAKGDITCGYGFAKAGAQPAKPVTPDGFVLVPIEPTLDMLATGDAVWVDSARVLGCIATKSLYKAMLEAAAKERT